jgi:hypothetical protein
VDFNDAFHIPHLIAPLNGIAAILNFVRHHDKKLFHPRPMIQGLSSKEYHLLP